jgi:23S rRNA (guanosine2251-2'-O)-methyltransferase
MITFTPEEQRAIREQPILNVRPDLKGMDVDQVKNALKPSQADIICVFQSSIRDFNLGSAVRNCNAFNIKGFWIAGLRFQDKRGTVGAHHYLSNRRFADTQEAIDTAKHDGYTCIAVEQQADSVSLFDYNWSHEKIALFFGEEGVSLEKSIIDQCDFSLEIPQFGSVISINLATAAGIVLYSMRASRNG